MRLKFGWALIVTGAVGMVVHFWIATSWLWYELRKETKPFTEWMRQVYR